MDVRARGQHNCKGTRNGRSKLINSQVQEIRKLLELGHMLQKDIAKQFGVSDNTISFIKSGKIWSHIII